MQSYDRFRSGAQRRSCGPSGLCVASIRLMRRVLQTPHHLGLLLLLETLGRLETPESRVLLVPLLAPEAPAPQDAMRLSR